MNHHINDILETIDAYDKKIMNEELKENYTDAANIQAEKEQYIARNIKKYLKYKDPIYKT